MPIGRNAPITLLPSKLSILNSGIAFFCSRKQAVLLGIAQCIHPGKKQSAVESPRQHNPPCQGTRGQFLHCGGRILFGVLDPRFCPRTPGPASLGEAWRAWGILNSRVWFLQVTSVSIAAKSPSGTQRFQTLESRSIGTRVQNTCPQQCQPNSITPLTAVIYSKDKCKLPFSKSWIWCRCDDVHKPKYFFRLCDARFGTSRLQSDKHH